MKWRPYDGNIMFPKSHRKISDDIMGPGRIFLKPSNPDEAYF